MKKVVVEFGHGILAFYKPGILDLNTNTVRLAEASWPYTYGLVYSDGGFFGVAKEGILLPPEEAEEILKEYFS